MTSVSIIRSDKTKSPADIELLRYHNQHKRTDPEAIILKEYQKKISKSFEGSFKKIKQGVL